MTVSVARAGPSPPASATALKAGDVKLTLKASSKRVRTALGRMKSAKVAIAVTTTPASGRAATVKRTLTLKR